MSYSKTLAFTAFGIGAFLQGCSEDDEKTSEVTDCATLTAYDTLFSAESTAAADAECLACVSNDDGVDDDKADTDAAADWAAAWAKIDAAGSKDADRLIAGAALEACGAVRIATACSGVSVDIPSKDPVALQTEFLKQSAANVMCIVSVQIGQPDAATCASIKEGITKSGGSATFDCDADYSCVPLEDYQGEVDEAGAAVAACSTCLDSKSGTGKTWTDLVAATPADFLVMVSALEHCNAQQNDARCADVTLDAADLTQANMEAKAEADLSTDAEDAECLLCANINLASSPTCAQSMVAFQDCGADVAAVKCDACADFDSAADVNCGKCLNALSHQAISPRNDNVATFVESMLPFTTCQATIADDAAFCSTALELADVVTTTNTDLLFQKLDTDTAAELPCRNCVYYHLANLVRTVATDAYTCVEFQGAVEACSESGVAHTFPTDCVA